MGDVWLATDRKADRPVALKFIKPQLLADPNFRTRFLNEARTLGRLEHDRIVTLYNVLEADGHLALVLRYIPGRSLAGRIDEEGALPLDVVLACARDILPALGFAHTHGIIHRDIKPQNVLLDGKGRAFLTDFGIAVGDIAQRSTMTGFAVGTPHYMSPEQIQTPEEIAVERRGHRTDIYSFGVVLFEMLTGRVPFGADLGPTEIYRVQHAHCVEAPPSLRELNPQVPEPVEALVRACLAKAPDERPQSCEALLAELETAAAGRPAQTPTRAARSATVFEGGGARQPAPAPDAKKPAPPPVTPRRTSSKTMWLGAGAAVIVALVSAAIWAQRDGGPVSEPSPVETAKPEPDALVPQPPADRTRTAPVPQRPSETNPQPQIVATTPAPGTPVAPDRSQETAAIARLVAQARNLGSEEQWCLAKEKMDEAARIGALNASDRYFQEQASIACGLAAAPQ